MKLKSCLFVFIALFSSHAFALSVDDIIDNVKANQDKIKTFKAYYTKTVTSSLFGKPMIEKGVYFKKNDFERKDIKEPHRKVVITTPKEQYEKDLETGQEKRINMQDTNTSQTPLTAEQALDQFDFQLLNTTQTTYTLEGIYQKSRLIIDVDKNNFVMSKMQFHINNKPSMTVFLGYQKINNLNVLQKTTSQLKLLMGKTPLEMKMEMIYKGIKVNHTLSDTLFEI